MASTSNARHAVVVGCGLMGVDIAAIFLNAGWSVTGIEPEPARWPKARERAAASVAQLEGRLDPAAFTLVGDATQVRWDDGALVIECAPEQLELKRRIFRQLDTLVPPTVPIGSNSSGLPISRITDGCRTAGRMANAHFFLPAHLVPLVELAKGEQTSRETLGVMRSIFKDVGRVPVQIDQDLPGFLANRIQHALMREAFSIIDRGLATPEDVDAAVRYGFGLRYLAAGPILQKELSGLETQLAASSAIYPSLCNDTQPSAGLAARVSRGELGAKTLKGFWSWTEETLADARRRFETTLLAAARLLRDERGSERPVDQ